MATKKEESSGSSDATTVRAKRGERFAIELPCNATTGYRWELEPAAPHVRLVTRDRSPAGGALGAGGTERFVFEAVEDGSTTIGAVYKRPWESEAIEKRVFRVKVGKTASRGTRSRTAAGRRRSE
jgi:inhibitor of cysteine peptidase